MRVTGTAAAVGTNNTASGVSALQSVTASGTGNSAFGQRALANDTTGAGNTGVGATSLYNNASGSQNVGFGRNTLAGLVSGTNNSALGSYALANAGAVATAGAFVSGISYTIASIGTTDFTLIGASANTVGTTFTATGAGSGTGTATPNSSNNVAVGYVSGNLIAYGSNNTVIGANFQAASGTTGVVVLATGDGVARADYSYTNVGSWTFSAPVKPPTYTVATLPSASTVGAGARAAVTDATSPTFGAAPTGGGSAFTPVVSNGTTWQVG